MTREVWIHQEAYIHYLCDEYGLSEGNVVSTPMDHHHPSSRDGEIFLEVSNLDHAYRKIVGELIYLFTCSRPDIAFAVQRLAQQCIWPEAHHFAAVKRVIQYQRGTQSLHIHFGDPKVDHSPYAFSDSDWAADPSDRMSVTGYVWFLLGVQWRMRQRSRSLMHYPLRRPNTWPSPLACRRGSG